MKKLILIVLLAVTPMAFIGCASGTSSAQTQVVAKLAVQYAVIKVADKNPEKARRIVAIAKEVSALAGTENAGTVDLLVALIRSKVNFSKLDAADTLLVNALIDAIAVELKAKVGEGPLLPEKILVVKQVADWVVDAASFAL